AAKTMYASRVGWRLRLALGSRRSRTVTRKPMPSWEMIESIDCGGFLQVFMEQEGNGSCEHTCPGSLRCLQSSRSPAFRTANLRLSRRLRTQLNSLPCRWNVRLDRLEMA